MTRDADGRAFYERLGWRADGAHQVGDFGDAHPAEVRYRLPMHRHGNVPDRS